MQSTVSTNSSSAEASLHKTQASLRERYTEQLKQAKALDKRFLRMLDRNRIPVITHATGYRRQNHE